MYLDNVLCNFRRFITFEKCSCFCPQCNFSIKCPEVLASLISKDLFFSWKEANIDKVHWIANICKLTVNFRHFCWLLQCVVCYLEAPNCNIQKFNSRNQAMYRPHLSLPRKSVAKYTLEFLIHNSNLLFWTYLKMIIMFLYFLKVKLTKRNEQ